MSKDHRMKKHQPKDKAESIKLNKIETSMYEDHTHLTKNNDGSFDVWLDIGVQHFRLAVKPEDEHHADWHARMLGKALANLVSKD